METAIYIYDKASFAVVRTIDLEGATITAQETALDKIAAENDYSRHDFVLICPENKPNLRTFPDFVAAVTAPKTTETLLICKQCLYWAARDGITQQFSMPSKGKTTMLPTKFGTYVYIAWTAKKSPYGERLYSYTNRSDPSTF